MEQQLQDSDRSQHHQLQSMQVPESSSKSFGEMPYFTYFPQSITGMPFGSLAAAPSSHTIAEFNSIHNNWSSSAAAAAAFG